MPGTLIMAENMAAMAVNPRSQASTATGQCLQRYLAATMHKHGKREKRCLGSQLFNVVAAPLSQGNCRLITIVEVNSIHFVSFVFCTNLFAFTVLKCPNVAYLSKDRAHSRICPPFLFLEIPLMKA